jgi:general nucleoside transport system ATP-binding protein
MTDETGVRQKPKMALEVVKLTKRFGDFVALDDVSFEVRQGAFHALLGENGAGKSTLVKCIIGYQAPTVGDVLVNGREVRFSNTRQAHAAGIGMVYQQFTLVPNMTVAENLVLVRSVVPSVINWAKERLELQAFMDQMPFRVPLDVPVRALSAGDKQKLEILKQLYLRREILFLDEPTSVLTPGEADEVLGLLHRLTREGKLTVLMITHKFREVTQFADRITVLRRGKMVGEGNVSELTVNQMAAMMVGEQSLTSVAMRPVNEASEVGLQVNDLHALDDTGVPALKGLSFEVKRGEILGVAGVSGNGQTQLVEVLAGQRRLVSGQVKVKGKLFTATRAEIFDQKLTLLPEVPLDNACVADMSVSDNLALRDFDRPPILTAGLFVSRKAIREKARELVQRFKVRTPSLDSPIRNLSGGNVQRTVLARELSRPIDVLIAANPCFGLDFAATAEIRGKLVEARNAGAAVLLIGEDLDELLELSDRLVVLFEGHIAYETPTAKAERVEVGHYMAGH